MALISDSIPNLINGVSQQPFMMRSPTQAEAQVNYLSSVVDGLKVRPPTEHRAKLSDSSYGDAFLHIINRDQTEQYIVVATNGDLKVYDLDGNPKTVSFPDGKGYLSSLTPSSSFKALTVADYTFLINTGVTSEMLGDTTPAKVNEALVVVKQGNYGNNYQIAISPTSGASTAPAVAGTVASYSQLPSSASVGAIYKVTQSTSATNDDVYVQWGVVTPASGGYSVSTSSSVPVGYVFAFSSPGSGTNWYNGGDGSYTLYTWYSTPAVYGWLAYTPSSTVGVVVSWQSPDGSVGSHSTQIDTTNIAKQLLAGLQGSSLGSSLDLTRYGNAIHIKYKDGRNFGIATEDGYGGNGLVAIKSRVQKFNDLPKVGPNGFLVEVVGEDGNAYDNYYLKFTKESDTDGSGVWKEWIAPGLRYAFDASTLPHVLVREADGTFTFKEWEWDERKVGDDDSAPEPSFIGKSIADIFFYKNRLGFLADENVIMSKAGSFNDFWPSTVTTILDDDPIDVATTHVKVSLLKHAIPFNQNLLLFSEQTQFVLKGGELLTPKTVSVSQSTEFNASGITKPVSLGKNIYFASERSNWVSIREYYVDNNTDVNDASDVTAHVPKYIPSSVIKIAAADGEDMLAVLSSGERNAVFIYCFYWRGNEKLQSSWSKWTFGGSGTKVLAAEFIKSNLFLVIERPDGVYLEVIDIDVNSNAVNEGSAYTFNLDRAINETRAVVSYDAVSNKTTWQLPYSVEDASKVMFVTRNANTDKGLPEGYVLQAVQQVSPTSFAIDGNYSATKVVIGVRYEARYRFSIIVVRDAKNNGGAVGGGSLTIQSFAVYYSKTGYFRAEVSQPFRDTYSYVFTGKIVGSGSNVIGNTALETGYFEFPIASNNEESIIELVSDSYLPCSFQSAEWKGMFVMHQRRL